jgi:hypothetical protein
MKKILTFTLLINLMAMTSYAATQSTEPSVTKEQQDIRSDKDFVATCPEQYLTYIDKSEGGPGAYCACPDDKISYIDKSEGGPGFYCEQ